MQSTSLRRFAVPSYLLHKPTGQARVRIDGRDHYLGAYGSAESKERYARLIAERSAAPSIQVTASSAVRPPTIVELCAAYIGWAQTYYVKNDRPTSQVDLIRMSLRALRTLYGSLDAHAFGPLALEALQQHLVSEGRSRPYINKLLGEIRRLFKWAARKELVPVTVYQALATVPGLKRGRCAAKEMAPVLPVDDATIDATLPHLPPVVADMVRFQRLVGCRPSEVCLLRPGDVDTSGDVWVYVPQEHKTEHQGRERRVFIGPQAQDVLRPYLLRPAAAYCFSPIDSERKRLDEMRERRKTRVQPSQLNRRKAKPRRQPRERYTKDSYNRAIHRAVDKLNAERLKALAAELGREATADETQAVMLPTWRPNQLRHAAATAIRREYGIEAAQTVLGHSRADVTQVYAERDWQKAADVMRAIG